MFRRALTFIPALAIAFMAMMPIQAEAALISVVLPEFSGTFDATPPFGGFNVGTFNYVIPAGEEIVAAQISGSFGNTAHPNSSGVDVSLDGVSVAQCVAFTTCYSSSTPTPWLYVFTTPQLAVLTDGSAGLFAQQTSGNFVRLGQTTLDITTRPLVAPVPEPASLLLLGTGLLGAGARRWRKSARNTDVE